MRGSDEPPAFCNVVEGAGRKYFEIVPVAFSFCLATLRLFCGLVSSSAEILRFLLGPLHESSLRPA